MRAKPIELSVLQPDDSRGNPQTLATDDGARPPTWNLPARREVAIEAVDEAFAALADQLARVDHTLSAQADATAPAGAGAQKCIPANRPIVASIVSQLELLDRQRDQLRQLLASIDGAR